MSGVNPTRYKIRNGTAYRIDSDGRVTGEQIGPVPGFGQRSVYDPDSEEAQIKAAGDNKPVERMTHAELDAYAADHGVDLSGAATRDDKIQAIRDAQG